MAPEKVVSDAELVKRAQRRDSEAFDQLISRYEKRVIHLCFRHLRQYEEACDLAQEVFLQVFTHLAQFKGQSSFSTWLYRVSLNACYNKSRWSRAKGRAGVSSLEGMLERNEAGADHAKMMAGKDPGALEEMEREEASQQVHEALRSLEPDYQKVVELVDMEGLSYEESSQVLKVPVNTVRSRLSRARQQLKTKITRLRKRLGDEE